LVDQLTSLKHQAMLRQNFIKNAALIVSCTLLTGIQTLSAQSLASQYIVNQAKQEVSSAVHLIEKSILLALSAGVAFLCVIFVCYVIREYTQSNRAQLKVERDL
jgi:hypothetical protein